MRLLAADLVKVLGVDFGYLSRILALFEKRGWLNVNVPRVMHASRTFCSRPRVGKTFAP